VTARDYRECARCGEWGWFGESRLGGRHECAPLWRVWIGDHHDPDDPSDGIEARADDAEDAAAKACEEWDEERGMLRGGEDCVVRPAEGGESTLVRVEAEATVQYRGRELRPEETEA
jgi:hypothetical protein